MGRENYVCRRRLDEAVAAEGEGLPDLDRSLALAYLVGRARRGDVDLSALPYRATRELPALADLARELRSSRATASAATARRAAAVTGGWRGPAPRPRTSCASTTRCC